MDKSFVELLKKYFDETPRDQVLKDWKETEEYDSIGPAVDEFLNNNNNLKNQENGKEDKSNEEN